MKTITIKLTKANSRTGPFTIKDQNGNTIAESISKSTLINGISYIVDDDVTMVTLISNGKCVQTKTKNLVDIPVREYTNTVFAESATACLWKHHVPTIYNNYYGVVEPYILEQVMFFNYQEEIVQSIKDYSKVYKYFSNPNGFSYADKISMDDKYFNKLIVYNDQQCSGILELVPKPVNNLFLYMQYPLYGTESKTIMYTKSDGYYNVNDFWDIVKDRTVQLFDDSCESLSLDKELKQTNMVYTRQSFKQYPIRSKDVRIRYILDNNSSVHIVSQIIFSGNQISYK